MAFAVDFGYGTIAAARTSRSGACPSRDNHGDHEAVGQRARTLGQHRRRDELHDPGPHGRDALKASLLFPAVHERPQYIHEMAGRDRGHPRSPGHQPASLHGRLLRGRWAKPETHRTGRTAAVTTIAPEWCSSEAYDGYSSARKGSARKCPT